MSDTSSNEEGLIKQRREKLSEMRKLGWRAFACPDEDLRKNLANAESPGNTRAQLVEQVKNGEEFGEEIWVAGRISSRRDMGKSQFFDISDISGRLQCFLNKKNIDEESFYLCKHLLDLGDWIAVFGQTFVTKTGEPSVRVAKLLPLCKTLRPMPDKWLGISDVELRYRRRYLDLIANKRSREIFIMRSKAIAEMRRYLNERDFLEVETPMLQDSAGGAAAEPFKTHHKALDMPLYLRIAPELYLKRLLVGGMTKIYELNRNFRNEGISRRHNPEFTMLEVYWAFADFNIMADLLEDMICSLATNFVGSLRLPQFDSEGERVGEINLKKPWRRISYHDALEEVAPGWQEKSLAEKQSFCREIKAEINTEMLEYELGQQVFEKLFEAKVVDPVFVTSLPSELVPLAKRNDKNPQVVDVYELIIGGQEISPGYSELNDPEDQRQRLEDQAGEEKQKIDEEFLLALEYGMPPAGGIGVGIDRLLILLSGAPSIRDVTLFPQLRGK